MLVAPTQNSPIPALLTGTGETAHQASTATSTRLQTAADTKAQTAPAVPGDTVKLSALKDRPADSAPLPVYAEVWKNGVKVASIDSGGNVTSFVGPVAPPTGGAVGGPWLAAIRAAQVAQSVGGEIHINGLTVDAGTLRTRVQLETAYGR